MLGKSGQLKKCSTKKFARDSDEDACKMQIAVHVNGQKNTIFKQKYKIMVIYLEIPICSI